MRERYRLVLFRKPLAPWRETRVEALNDALRLGHAEYDARYRVHFLIVPAEIETGYQD